MLLDGYRDYAQAEGAFPLHPLLMMDDNPIGASHFVASDTSSLVDDVKWRTLRLSALQIMSPQARRKQIDAFVAGLPEGAIAHRAGDFVFTCPGVDPAALTADVWLVIYSPMPEVRQTHNPFAASVYVGQADGTVIVIPKATFQNSLRAQRATRRRNNLPPLPDLSSITHNRPAVADAGDGS